MDATTHKDENKRIEEREPIPLVTAEELSMSDSDLDDDLNSFADDALDQLNLPSNLKNILRMGAHEVDVSFEGDDSESDDDLIRKKISTIDLDKLNDKIQKNKFKFKDFGAAEQEEEEAPKPKKKSKKPQGKKRRRDKGKEKFDILQEDVQLDRLDRVLSRFKDEESDEESVQKKPRKKGGRKTRKHISNEPVLDENGERMIRTTSLLDDTSSSSEDEKPLSKKEEEEMYRENERLRRNKKIGLQPVYNVKSFDDFVKRREEREEQYLKELNSEKPQKIPPPTIEQDSDSDLEIIGDPKKIAASLVSPVRYPFMNLSPIKPKSSFKEFNRKMLERITNEGYNYRIKMEAAAKARGQFASATERAKRLMEREKDALMINEQINQHFEKKKKHVDSDEEEDDLYELSGSDDDFAVEDAEDTKRKLSDSENEEDMATVAFKRWKNKKVKKSIFDEDDEEEETKKPVQKPEPKHSIAHFFKTKETETAEEDTSDEKHLSRLVQKEDETDIPDDTPGNKVQDDDEQDDDEQDSDNDDDGMEVDENIPKLTTQQPIIKQKIEYLEEEAEEEEDEFFGAGGSDGEDDENLDEFEKDDLLVEDNNEHVDEGALRDAFNKQDEESDKNLIQRLITDITSGGLRKQKAAAEAGLMLEDVDLYDEEDNDLVAIRRLQAARRRKLLKMRGGDALENLLKDPKTAAFAKAAQAIPDEAIVSFLSDEEAEDEEVKETVVEEKIISSKRVIIEEDDDEEEEEKVDILDNFSDDENLLIIDEMDEMATPLREVAEDGKDIFQVETMLSPIASRKAKTSFSSPSNMERFKRLIFEASNASNSSTTSGGPVIGFGSVKNRK